MIDSDDKILIDKIMIPAQHTWWADKIFRIYLHHLLKKHFHAIHLFDKIPAIDPQLPLILAPNHSTWWDGFFIYWLNKNFFRRRGFLMMLESQLQKYRFFTRIGAYSVDPQKPKKITESLRYTLEILQNNTSSPPMICIFPQGELRPWSKRPLELKRGLDWLLKHYRNPVNLLPLALRAEFAGEQRPEVFFLTGKNHLVDFSSFPGMAWLEQTLSDLLDKLEHDIVMGAKSHIIYSGSHSVNIQMDRILGRD